MAPRKQRKLRQGAVLRNKMQEGEDDSGMKKKKRKLREVEDEVLELKPAVAQEENEDEVAHEENEDEENDEDDFTGLTLRESQQLAKSRGLKGNSRKGREELMQMLREQGSTAASAGSKILDLSPCHADATVFDLQMPFIQVVKDSMPANDKMMPASMDDEAMALAINLMTTEVARSTDSFKSASGEEQERQHKSSILVGLKSIVGVEDEVTTKAGPVCYEEKKQEIGKKQHSPNVDMDTGKEAGMVKWNCDFKTFVKDPEMATWCSKNLRTGPSDEWLLKLLTEAKWGVKPKDIYQAALNGCKEMEARLISQLPVERVYLHVWGKASYQYGILDVYGYVSIEDNAIAGYTKFEGMVNKMKARMRDQFEELSYQRCMTLPSMQRVLQNKQRILREKYDVRNSWRLSNICFRPFSWFRFPQPPFDYLC